MKTFKKTVKTYLDNSYGKKTVNYASVKKQADYVSFDIFDTLVKRDVNKPTDVFKILEKQRCLPGFCSKRIKAEQKARLNKISGEVTLEEIYQCFDGIELSEVKDYCSKEINTELKLCHRNNRMFSFYQECVRNKKVVLISDMYLSSDMVGRILDKCGIKGYEKLYISCEAGVSKHDSALYKYVLRDLGISADRMVHIGNDFVSDSIKPTDIGIESWKVRTKTNNLLVGSTPREQTEKSGQFSLIYNFINNTTGNSKEFDDFYFRFGYENFGILLMGFTKWLFNEMQRQGIEQVLFIARDGYILKQAYETMGFSKTIPAFYFEVSRRSIRVPATFSVPHSFEESVKLINVIRRISIRQLFDSWGLEIDNYDQQLEEAGVGANDVFWKDEILGSASLRKLYSLIETDILNNGIRERELLEAYIDQFDFHRKTALVDIGYGGTIQKELLKVFRSRGMECDVHGFYIIFEEGRLNENTEGLSIDIDAYLMLGTEEKTRFLEVNPYVGLYETFFLEGVGSVKRYAKKDGNIVIERYEYEYAAPGGEIDETALVSQIRKGAMSFIEAASAGIIGRLKSIDYKNAFYLLDRALSHPTKEITEHFYNFRFFNLGEAQFLAKPKKGLAAYCVHPNELKKEFFGSMWKYGFLRKLFGFNVPYKTIRSVYGLFKTKE